MEYTARRRGDAVVESTTESSEVATPGLDNSWMQTLQEMMAGWDGGATGDKSTEDMAENATTAEERQEVVLYMTLNNTTHKQDEIPEAMSALKKAEAEGLGHKELIPISDPYWSKKRGGGLDFGDHTDQYAFGEEGANRVEFWHGNDDMTEGQVKVDGEILQLGTDDVDMNDLEQQKKLKENWRNTLLKLGMDKDYAESVMGSLLEDEEGNFKKLASGDGAINELVQYAMVMYRSEKDEFDVKDVVLSGHHWRNENYEGHGQGIWGEVAGQDHVYDDEKDYFGLEDVRSLKSAFPNAYSKVESVQYAACNTDDLGMRDKDGNAQTTNEFTQDVFENVQVTSYWKKILAPLAKDGAETNGEFLLDVMRYQNGDKEAIKDSRHNARGLKRSILGEDGDLEEIAMKTKRSSYTGSGRNGEGSGAQHQGLRGQNKDFDERKDLADYLMVVESLPEVLEDKPKVN